MAFINYYFQYETDGGKEVPMHIKYDEAKNAQERIDIGKITITQQGFCRSLLNRQKITPRILNHSEYGEIVFKKHSDWIDFIKNNKDKVKSYTGERLSCVAVQAIY